MVPKHKEKLTADPDLVAFLKQTGCNDLQFKLLCFWSRHPKAKLGIYSIAKALNTPLHSLTNAIAALVKKGMITHYYSNGLTTYAIADQPGLEYINELTKLDWSEMVRLGKQLKSEEGKYYSRY